MKKTIFILTLLVIFSLACSLGGVLSPDEERTVEEAQQPAPTKKPSSAPDSPSTTSQNAPADTTGEAPTMESYHAWLNENHSLDYADHDCSKHSDTFNSIESQGGGVIPLDESYFYITWFPENWEQVENKRVIFSLHGNGGCAEQNFIWWHNLAKANDFAFVALQYAQGQGTDPDKLDFMGATEVYEQIKNVLNDLNAHVPMNDALLVYHGFSRGSALSFQIALLDRAPDGMKAFTGFISDSGGGFGEFDGEVPDYFQTASDDAYEGAHFWLYCGGKDHEGRTCQDMHRMEKIIPSLGGVVDELYTYDTGGHGIFITAENKVKSDPIKAMIDYIKGLGN